MNKLIWYAYNTIKARINYLALCIGEVLTNFLRKRGYVSSIVNGKVIWGKKR